MSDDRQEEFAALYAFGLLEGSERTAFEAELAGDLELRRLVAELRLTAAGLAHAAPSAVPPPELRARVLASAAAGRTAARPRAQVVRFPTWIPWLAAAALALAVLGSTLRSRRLAEENERLRGDARQAVSALQQAQSQLDRERTAARRQAEQMQAELAQAQRLEADASRRLAALAAELKNEGDLAKLKIATLASMLGNSPAALAVAVWDPAREQGVLSVSKLPAAAAEKDYQLWVIDAHQAAPISAGIFVVDPVTGEAHVVFRADKPVTAAAKFAVSLERKGGVASREGPIVLISP
jgi:anti-sigma-K factor RskA